MHIPVRKPIGRSAILLALIALAWGAQFPPCRAQALRQPQPRS